MRSCHSLFVAQPHLSPQTLHSWHLATNPLLCGTGAELTHAMLSYTPSLTLGFSVLLKHSKVVLNLEPWIFRFFLPRVPLFRFVHSCCFSHHIRQCSEASVAPNSVLGPFLFYSMFYFLHSKYFLLSLPWWNVYPMKTEPLASLSNAVFRHSKYPSHVRSTGEGKRWWVKCPALLCEEGQLFCLSNKKHKCMSATS